jgi:hypothetical protein
VPPAPPPKFDDIEAAAGPAAQPDVPTTPAAAANGDAALPAEAYAEIGVRALYAVTGAVIGDHKAATASGAEHKNLTAVATAYIRHRGWVMVGFIAVVGTVAAYMLMDGRREPLMQRIKTVLANLRKKKPQNVTPMEEHPVDSAPAEPVAETKPAAPALPEIVEKY